jgi:hypothetical protein
LVGISCEHAKNIQEIRGARKSRQGTIYAVFLDRLGELTHVLFTLLVLGKTPASDKPRQEQQDFAKDRQFALEACATI